MSDERRYDNGGWLPPGRSFRNRTEKPLRVWTAAELERLAKRVAALEQAARDEADRHKRRGGQ